MLERLEIQQLALIESTAFEPAAGFTVITGETGAGKSLLLGAVDAISGSKMNKEQIRNGSDHALVQANFSGTHEAINEDLWSELALTTDEVTNDEFILTRQLNINGKSICRLNGRLLPLSKLKNIGNELISIHGQRDGQKIFEVSEHAHLLIKYAVNNECPEYDNYLATFREWRKIKREIEKIGISEEERLRLIDLLQYQCNEIGDFAPVDGEEEQLRKQRQKIKNMAVLLGSLQKISFCLDGNDDYGSGALNLLQEAEDELRKIDAILIKTGLNIDSLAEGKSIIEAFSLNINKISNKLDYDPELLEKIEQRLDKLANLKKKYGNTEAKIIEFFTKAKIKLEQLTEIEITIADLQVKESQVYEKMVNSGRIWHQYLQSRALELSREINVELADLGMKKAEFFVAFTERETITADEYGWHNIEFLLAANVGEGFKPLAKIASGGEAARILLAIKVILARVDSIPVLIFDEVDAGVSGETAARVGEKLLLLSRNAQVICVTHSAYIASMADKHYMISKCTENERTRTNLIELDESKARSEIARLLAGDTDRKLAEKLAESLQIKAKEFKLQIH